MPYQTPSASQFIQLKRIQSAQTADNAINPLKRRAPNRYDGYQQGLDANYGPNALLSNKFIEPSVAPPSPPPNTDIAVDLTGLTFAPWPPGGDSFSQKFTLPSPKTTITVGFYNTNASINQVTHLQFNTWIADNGGALTNGDTFTIDDPAYGPSGTYVVVPGARQIIYDNNTTGPTYYGLKSSSVITLTTTNPISIISFDMN